jgi:hypothetical protein
VRSDGIRQNDSRDCNTSHSYQIVVHHTFEQSNLTQLYNIQDRDDMRAEESKQHLGPSRLWTQNAAARVKEYEF